MKTIKIKQRLVEEALDQLKAAQEDCYVQSTQDVIDELELACNQTDILAMLPNNEKIQAVILGQDIWLSINSKEPTKFRVIKSDNEVISLVAHHVCDDNIYSLTLRLIPPMPPEGLFKNDR